MFVSNDCHHYVDLMQRNNPVQVHAFVDIYQNPYYVLRYVERFRHNIHK